MHLDKIETLLIDMIEACLDNLSRLFYPLIDKTSLDDIELFETSSIDYPLWWLLWFSV